MTPDSLIDVLLYGLIAVVLIGPPNRTRTLGAGALFAAVLAVVVAYPLVTGRSVTADPALAEVEAAFELLNQGDPDAAAQAFHAVIAEHPDLAEAHNGLAVAYHSQGRYEEALAELNRALELKADDPAIWGNRAWVFMELERYEECLPDADRAIALDARAADYHDTRATCLIELERLEEAVAASTRAIELAENNPFFYVTRGWAHWDLGDFDLARQDWQEAIRLLPADDPNIALIEEWLSEIVEPPQ